MSSTPFRPRLVLGLLAAAVTVLLAVPSLSHASLTGCAGRLTTADEADTLGYSFRCDSPILGYSIVFDQEILGFETEVPVLTGSGVATNELFSCEGDFPSFGIGCFGAYTVPGHEVRSTVGLDRDACADPRYKAWLTAVTGPKGQTAGPFSLRGPVGCDTKTGPIKRLMAWIELLKAELAG